MPDDLANLLFTRELQRRLERAGAGTSAVAAHPGWTRTDLQRNSGLARLFNPVLAMEPWQGALPTLYAATSADARGGEYYGPDGLMGMRGYPRRGTPTKASQDPSAARRLWEMSEDQVGIRFSLPADDATFAAA